MIDLQGKRGLVYLGLGVVISFIVGIIIGHVATSGDSGSSNEKHDHVAEAQGQDDGSLTGPDDMQSNQYDAASEDKWTKEKHLISKILKMVNAENIKQNLKYLSSKPHLAATPRDEELAKHMETSFKEAAFDHVRLVPYNLYLSKPDPQNPNKVTLMEGGVKIFESSHKEIPIHPDDEDPDFIHAYNAFTPAGTVSTAPGVGVVYVNYGRLEDFEKLEELGVNITGHIALVRYGKIFRGNKVRHAEKSGAKGIIIFTDPADVALEGTDPKDVYDNSWWLPGTGMQRGSTYLGEGDPLTPGWPSTEHAYRIEEEEADLHRIPSQPIGYDDAEQILSRLAGDDAPDDWQGGIKGLTYKLGPFFNLQNNNVSLTLSTHNSAKIEKNYNVIGIIKGSIEPDRYVLIGNHRDAWGYGASDPSSGTAQLLETARVLGVLLKEGWRPRRTMVFCSWGAEEFGLIGSTEWVEENVEKLQSRAVAYINTDTCVSGPVLDIAASPLLQGLFYEVTKMIPGVINETKTLYEEWKEYSERLKPDAPEHPIILNLGSGSDYAHFSIYAGIPGADIWFRRDQVKHNITIYPYYHTGYETFYMVSTFVDPDFKIHQGCSRLASLVIKYLADASIIPYSLSHFPKIMSKILEKSKQKEKLMKIYDKYVELENSLEKFKKAVEDFEAKTKQSTDLSILEQRMINDQMMKLEQIFILPEGLPGRPVVRNVVFASSQFDNYAVDGFPGLTDLLHKYDTLNSTEKMKRDKKIKRHISDLTILTDRASAFLEKNFIV